MDGTETAGEKDWNRRHLQHFEEKTGWTCRARDAWLAKSIRKYRARH